MSQTVRTGCDICDQHGPPLPCMEQRELLDLHRAMHDISRSLVHAVRTAGVTIVRAAR